MDQAMMNEVMIIFIVLCTFIGVPLFYIAAVMKAQKVRNTKKEILENVIPNRFILEDIIIIKRFGYNIKPKDNDKIIRFGSNNDLNYLILPLIRDVKTNELLMSLKKECYGTYKYSWSCTIFTTKLNWQLKDENDLQINIGDSGMYYLKEYTHHNMEVQGNIIYLDDIKYKYMGNIADSKLTSEVGNCLLFNVNRNNSIASATQIKFFKGCINFEQKNIPNL